MIKMILIDGKSLATKIRQRLKIEVDELKLKTGKVPGLATILVGENPASQVYIRIKHKACEEGGINSIMVNLSADITFEKLSQEIEKLNSDESIHGILLQLPIPKHLNAIETIKKINPSKDVDGLHPINTGKLMIGIKSFIPCTPKGILTMLDEYNIDVKGKNVVLVNRSNLVGKPLIMLLLRRERSATLTVCHSFTKNLSNYTKNADILIVGIGKSKFIKKDMVKDGAVIIDVGTNRDENSKLCGDVDFDDVKYKVHAITPSPGGVGPMTVASLLENTLIAFKNFLIN